MTTAYIGLGSNLGKRQTALRTAIERLGIIPATRVVATATFRETDAVDSPPGAPKFINSAVRLETALEAEELLSHLLRIERELGRERQAGLHNETRIIDLDLLLLGNQCVSTDTLSLPHPRMHLRRFVLEPLVEIAPDAIHPTTGKTIRELLAALEVTIAASTEGAG